MSFKVPAFLRDNPAESIIAVALLLGLLFITADGTNPATAGKPLLVAVERN
jgi:hypothetical protein